MVGVPRPAQRYARHKAADFKGIAERQGKTIINICDDLTITVANCKCFDAKQTPAAGLSLQRGFKFSLFVVVVFGAGLICGGRVEVKGYAVEGDRLDRLAEVVVSGVPALLL